MLSIFFPLVLTSTTGIDALGRLDLLPTLRTGKVAAITSYDRTEGNDDGFSGKYSFVRKEGDTLVLADLKGPGCIMRIHTPTPTDDPLEFYFDGETTPRLRLAYKDLFSGKVPPFVTPVVSHAGGGDVSYVPMPYAKSCKVVLRAKSTQFYDLNYATYPVGTPVRTFDPKAPAPKLTLTPKGQGTGFSKSLAPGKAVTLFESEKGGRINRFRVGPAEAFEGKERDILLRITWDDAKRPAVLMPVGDFFGYAWGKPAMASGLVGTTGGMNYCNLPMPFAKAAKIELVSRRTGGASVTVRGDVMLSAQPRRADEGEFYAEWRRENPATTGKPFTWLDTKGKGHLVGLTLQSQGLETGNTFFFEGDDKTIVDGEMVVHGTGSEDFFNGGWYDVPGRWDGQFSRPLSGCLGYQRYLGRTGAYRFFLGDAYSFDRSIVQTIEHGPTKNEHPVDYVGVAYLYLEKPPTEPLADLSAVKRRVADPTRLVYSAHWTMPIEGFSLQGTTLTRGPMRVENRSERVLSLRAQTEGDFDLLFVTLRADIPAAGRYKVYLDTIKGPESGQVQFFKDDVALGSPVDLYAPKATAANGLYMGEITAVEGGNPLMFKVIGKNPAATGRGMDLVNVVLVKS
jgi:hypothetical protein